MSAEAAGEAVRPEDRGRTPLPLCDEHREGEADHQTTVVQAMMLKARELV